MGGVPSAAPPSGSAVDEIGIAAATAEQPGDVRPARAPDRSS